MGGTPGEINAIIHSGMRFNPPDRLSRLFRKPGVLLLLCLIVTVAILNISKKPRVFYLPFGIPGKQAAATIPPFGMFFEAHLKHEDKGHPMSYWIHEKAHWAQYRRMGLLSFYYNYIREYLKHGRGTDHWMEKEASRKRIEWQMRQTGKSKRR